MTVRLREQLHATPTLQHSTASADRRRSQRPAAAPSIPGPARRFGGALAPDSTSTTTTAPASHSSAETLPLPAFAQTSARASFKRPPPPSAARIFSAQATPRVIRYLSRPPALLRTRPCTTQQRLLESPLAFLHETTPLASSTAPRVLLSRRILVAATRGRG